MRGLSVANNDAGAELIRRARDLGAHMVVVGCTHKGTLDRWVLGSVSRTVVRQGCWPSSRIPDPYPEAVVVVKGART